MSWHSVHTYIELHIVLVVYCIADLSPAGRVSGMVAV